MGELTDPGAVECVFCRIVRGEPVGGTQVLRSWGDSVVFAPLSPVVPGHLLVVPTQHVVDAAADPGVTGQVFVAAAYEARIMRWTASDCNLITSCGSDATQTVPHMHVHVVPRRRLDRVALPWTKDTRAGG